MKNYLHFTVGLMAILLATSLTFTVINMRWSSGTKHSPENDNRVSDSHTASYTVYKNGTTYYAEANFPGGTDYSGTDGDVVLQAAADALANGGKIVLKGTVECDNALTISNDGITLEGEGCYSDIPSGIPDNSPTALYGSVLKITTANKDGIKITGQRHGIQIRNLGIWFTQSTTGHGITTDTTQTYTLTHFVIENIKVLNCDKSHYAIQLVNFLHGNVRAIMAWGGPVLHLYGNKTDFHSGNSIFDNIYNCIKYDLAPVTVAGGPYPIFIHKNDELSETYVNLLNMRRIQVNNPIAQTDADFYNFVAFNLRYSTIHNLDIESVATNVVKLGSNYHVTFDTAYLWSPDPGNSYLAVGVDNSYVTFLNSYLEDIADNNSKNLYINCEVAGTIDSSTVAGFVNLVGNSGTATITSGQSSATVNARFIGSNSYILLTIIDADALTAGEAIKVDTINVAPTNTFVVNCIDEGTASASITFYWEVKQVPS